jgi:hypothetical protein
MVFGALMAIAWVAALVCTSPLSAQTKDKKPPDPAQVAADVERAKLVVPIPAATADYVFGVDKALPGWEGMAGIATAKDYFGPGADAMDTQPIVYGKCFYWPLKGVKAGKYYIGLWAQSNDTYNRSEYSPGRFLATIYLNGWPVRFSTTSDPVQVKPPTSDKPAIWLAELQSKDAIDLKDGDEITVAGSHEGKYLRLCLYNNEPARGHGVTGQTWGMRDGALSQVQLDVKAQIIGDQLDGSEHEAKVIIGNPLPYAAKIDADVLLADYYGKPVVKETVPLTIESHKTAVVSRKFKAVGTDIAYQMSVKTRPSEGATLVPRPLEMVPLNAFARLGFLPSRPGPLDVWQHTRMELSRNQTGQRMLLTLDGGDWQMAPLTTRRVPQTVPDKLDFKQINVPDRRRAELPEGIYGQWYRKTFKLPSWMTGQRYIVEVTQVVVEGTMFMNGVQVGCKREGSALPLVVDVTDQLKKDADNELVICARGAIAMVADNYVDKCKPSDGIDVDDHADWVNNPRPFVSVDSVFLHTAPEVRVKQAMALPQVDQGKLKVLARVENTAKEARDVQLKIAVEQFGNAVDTQFADKKVHLNAGEMQEVSVEGTVKGLTPYTPKNPALSKLLISIVDGDKNLDTFAQRFGYRQARLDGLEFKYNGQPKRMMGAFQHGEGNLLDRQEAVEGSRDYQIRGEWCPIDNYDETGMFTYIDVDGMWMVNWARINNPKRWESARRVAVEYAWLLQSRPCVLGYDLSNEGWHYAPYSCGPEGQSQYGDLLMSVAKAMRDTVDPHLWIMGDGEEDYGGKLDFCSFHYLNQGVESGTWSMPEGIADQVKGGFHYSPDCFFINGSAKEPQPGTVLGACIPPWKYGSHACGETETFWFFGNKNGVPMCAFLGDKASVSSNYQFFTGPGMSWTKGSLDAYRDMDEAFIGGLYWRSFLATGTQGVTFIMPEQEIRYFSGAKVDRRLTVIDDEFRPGKLVFTWQLLDDNRQKVDGGEMSMDSTTKFLGRKRVAFDMPKVDKRSKYTLTLNLTKDGVQREYEERLMEVWPPFVGQASRLPESIRRQTPAMYDPKNQLAQAIKQIGIEAQSITKLDSQTLAQFKALIVGPMAFDESMSEQGKAIRDFAAAGGRVLLLEQTTPLALPADTYVELKGQFSTLFVRAGDHPVMKGLTDVDFQMWNPGHVAAHRTYRRPARGNFMTLVEGGHDGGLYWTPLMEVYLGKGSVLATQFPLTENINTEPMCAEMLVRMLAYLDQPVYRSAQEPLAMMNCSKEVQARLSEIRVGGTFKSDDPNVWLLDMSTPGQLESASFKNHVAAGGTLIVHRVKPDQAAWLSDVLGKTAKITVQPYQSWEDRQMIDQPASPLLTGLNNVDFYWRSQIVSEAGDGTEQVSNGVQQKIRKQVEYVVSVEGEKDLLFPGGLFDVKVGKGRVIIDQLNWEVSEEDIIGGSPKRVISMLLTNLGIAQRPPNPKPSLPAGVTYESVDITAQANTSTTDHKAGGSEWCSWGPNSDIRDMGTGKLNFQGIPFWVPEGKANAIALKTGCVDYLKTFPDSVTVPVGKDKVAGLYLLHTGGWTGGKASFGRREIWYSDGAKEVIGMNETDMGDWNYGHDQFPDEEYTTTTVAWRGVCQQYPQTRVYKTLWVNPHPEKKIDKIVITDAGLIPDQQRFVAHLAITLAMAPTGGPAAIVGDPAKAKALIAEATKLIEAKDTQGALEKLDAALAADPVNTGAWEVLTRLRATTDDVRTFTGLCQRWMTADPKNYQPYNTLGAFLETKGQKEEALKLYKRSLEIEWNQPPTGEAVRRLEKELKK